MALDPLEYLTHLSKENFRADLLKQARTRLNLSQEGFAQKLGISFSTYNAWESGKRPPAFEGIARLKDFARGYLKTLPKTQDGETLNRLEEEAQREPLSLIEPADGNASGKEKQAGEIILDPELRSAIMRLALVTNERPETILSKAVALYQRLVEDEVMVQVKKVANAKGHTVPGTISRLIKDGLGM